jgi:tartronate-semialdehyde synthase
MAGMVGPADQPPLRQRDRASASDFRAWASAIAGPTATPGSVEVYTKGRTFVHVDIEPTQIGRVFGPHFGHRWDADAPRSTSSSQAARERKAAGSCSTTTATGRAACAAAQERLMLRKTALRPGAASSRQRVY